MNIINNLSKKLPLAALCLGSFMVIIDITIVNVALPTMSKNLNIGIAGLQWIVDAYALTLACLLLSAGNLGDQVGAKATFICGLGLFISTSLGCGLVSTLGSLILFRLLQGAAAALLVPTSLALINASYETKQKRASAIGIWGGVSGIAGASGPIVGAVLTTWLSWRAVFFVNVPIGLITLLLTIKYVKNPIKQVKASIDFPGQITGMISIAALAYSLIEAGRIGWITINVVSSFIIFLITFITFLFIEYSSSTPMFPLTFFKSKTFSAVIAVGMINNIGFYGLLFILPLYFQQVHNYSVLLTGFAILPLPALSSIASYSGGKVASVTGPRIPMLIGLAIAAVGFLSIMLVEELTSAFFILILPLVVIGFGLAFTTPAATIAIINAVPDSRVGIASGAFNASRQVGSLIGVAIFGSIINIFEPFIYGMHITLVIGTMLYIIAWLTTFFWIKRGKLL